VRANREHRRFQKGQSLVQDAGVACRSDVFGDHEGQPEEIVGAQRAQTAATRFVPPVLNVALDELTPGGAEQMFPCELGPSQQQRHHVLQLIAKTVGSAASRDGSSCSDRRAID
jgi:hypothetical protein